MGKERVQRKQRHDPLHVELTEDANSTVKVKAGKKKFADRENRKQREENEEYIDPKLSRKILKIAREQQNEIEKDEYSDDNEDEDEEYGQPVDKATLSAALNDSDDEAQGSEEEEDVEYEELEVDEADQALLDKFLPNAPRARQTLADIIMAKIESQNNGGAEEQEELAAPPGINPKIVEVYTKVGELLGRYKSGKLPKAFKIIPSLSNWEDILYITQPMEWTPNAVYEATRIFVSNLKAKQSQKFFNLILLDYVRDDIRENKKLNHHLYMSLKKALYKPAAFFKGILFPLCESGSCTLKEAAIFGSVLTKVSVPVLHSSAALLRLAEMDYTGPNSLFIRVLLDKKYALPFKVIDALVFHFIRFKQDPREMPVLWHQSFLVFAQRYKSDLTPEQKDALLDVLRHKTHHSITAEIRREISNSTCRGEIREVDMMDM
ncbi:Bystin-domain-containing protein [Basidiobolus meristosporus CBS 931.73]|uniref:Bystin-domain-containing protein n=1 Tax=Basidiobolus meristosporus CBS 931.73 TaxID=1314790 RepID=A0A1Y1XWY3_9FUNG|nr:Bystin-domain-containing protein [Basidiobolus meristosporus CBS 931.73]ORX89864.1 Bystin-domain-containing protein [Basidiobolus meristosporus CBS 931.73]|eukprot:ORX68064.1 Bystin-domain-containing protein [Basidiobolus meristosporus CBS 931.73]